MSRNILIVGGGLAGCAVAWAAHRRGWTFTLVDEGTSDSCSRVAAGLVTPITGTRSALSWRWEEFFPEARAHYLAAEHATESSFWFEKPALRLFQSDEERQRATERWAAPSDGYLPQIRICEPEELLAFHAPFGGCLMQPSARLDTEAYLSESRRVFEAHHRWVAKRIDVESEIACKLTCEQSTSIQVDSLEDDYDSVVLCQGFASRTNSLFRDLPLHPARGDILTVDASELPAIDNVVHGESWIVPTADRCYRTGATYDRHTLDGMVDDRSEVEQAKNLLVSRFAATLKVPPGRVTINRHRAAVRPATYDRHPLAGRHPVHPNVFALNGLGSKGTLMAPLIAYLLCDCMAGINSIDSRLDSSRRPIQRQAPGETKGV